MRVEIVAYRPEWVATFRTLAAPIRATLGDRALRIDHIGSTSVPGLASKDRVDLQVTVAELADADALAAFLDESPRSSDHVPPGRAPGVEWSKRYFSPRGGPDANLHVRRAGWPNQRYALVFRDYLRAHPAAADAYAELKRRLARISVERVHYVDTKDPVCDLIAVAAEDWAAVTGWTPGPSDA